MRTRQSNHSVENIKSALDESVPCIGLSETINKVTSEKGQFWRDVRLFSQSWGEGIKKRHRCDKYKRNVFDVL